MLHGFIITIGVKLMEVAMKQGRAKLSCVSNRYGHHNEYHHQQNSEQQLYQQQQQPKNMSIIKMFNKVQVVYYLTRNGHLEHPHYIEVSHLATQPLRLRDVIERLTALRGKAMPSQYSWSCKRSYKSGYVWNDLTENDVIYASDGSEYVLKGSELIQDRDFSAEISIEDLQNKARQQKKINNAKPNDGLIPRLTHQRQSPRQVPTDIRNCESNSNRYEFEEEEDEEEEEKRVSCNSSTAAYSKPAVDDSDLSLQIEQEESYSLPSTSSTNSDKLPVQQQHPAATAKTTAASPATLKQVQPTAISESKRFEDNVTIEEDGDPQSTVLTRNTVLMQLMACAGGGSITAKSKAKASAKSSTSNFNFNNMRNTFIPCLKQQMSTRRTTMMNNNNSPLHKGVEDHRHCVYKAASKDEDDEDMIMVRYMSENPRFGNLQSEEKEFFSGTIVEAMTHHNHTHSSVSESNVAHFQGQPPFFTKSSSYNEQRSAKVGLQATATSSKEEEEDGNEDVKLTGIIKLCLPRKKSCPSNVAKSNKS